MAAGRGQTEEQQPAGDAPSAGNFPLKERKKESHFHVSPALFQAFISMFQALDGVGGWRGGGSGGGGLLWRIIKKPHLWCHPCVEGPGMASGVKCLLYQALTGY